MSIEQAFYAAQRVYNGEITQQAAANDLFVRYGVNVNTAKIMIAVYRKMVDGLEFKRALSASDVEYCMGRFLIEGGRMALRNPVRALLQHIIYYERKNGVELSALRSVYENYSAVCGDVTELNQVEIEFRDAVFSAGNLSVAERRRRASVFPRQPNAIPVTVKVYPRNPYVVAEVLARASGVCERCGVAAPFIRRRDGSPYLEVHHVVRLADGGPDIVQNAIALCPNCHRESHYG